jgi:hypothetical protein
MEKKENWFSRVKRVGEVGITVKGTLRQSHPVRQCPDPNCGKLFVDGFCDCGGKAGWRQTNCRKCNSMNAVVFQTEEDQYEFFIFCQKCNKWELAQGLPQKPVRRSKVSAEVGMDENCPPPLGSLTKPPIAE